MHCHHHLWLMKLKSIPRGPKRMRPLWLVCVGFLPLKVLAVIGAEDATGPQGQTLSCRVEKASSEAIDLRGVTATALTQPGPLLALLFSKTGPAGSI